MNRLQALRLLDKYKLSKNMNEINSPGWYLWNHTFIKRLVEGEFHQGMHATPSEVEAYEAAEEVLAIECVAHVS